MPAGLLGLDLLPLLGQRDLFALELADLLQQLLQLAVQHRLLAAERALLVLVLGDLTGQFDFGGVRPVDVIAQCGLLLLERAGGGVVFRELRGQLLNAGVDLADLLM